MWKDKLKKKHFEKEYESTHPDAKPIYIFKQNMDGLISDIEFLLKQQRENCRLAYYKERGYNLPSSTRFPEGVESIIGNVILNAPEPTGEKK